MASSGDERATHVATRDRDHDGTEDSVVATRDRPDARDERSESGVTAADQGNNDADLNITQQIRQAVVADDNLSFAAKNVTIVTTEGVVTLRGEVNSDSERATIVHIAQRVNGVRRLNNELQVDAD
jgi:osmotically-inducible protein OsmY